MKSWVRKSDGRRFPERGCGAGFTLKPGDKRVEWWIRDIGRKTEPVSKWRQEEIPDLPHNHTLQEFRAYAKAYGRDCAAEFLSCCDMMKPTEAALRMHSAYPDGESRDWFMQKFGADPRGFAISLAAMFGHFSFDIVEFEKYLIRRHGYTDELSVSMAQFLDAKFGAGTADTFERWFLKSELTSAKSPG